MEDRKLAGVEKGIAGRKGVVWDGMEQWSNGAMEHMCNGVMV